jgi:hypothetical protein
MYRKLRSLTVIALIAGGVLAAATPAVTMSAAAPASQSQQQRPGDTWT